MFNLRDIVNFKTPMNPVGNWGVIAEISEIKHSIYVDNEETTVYKIVLFENSGVSYSIVEEKDIVAAYSKYYDKVSGEDSEDEQ